MLEHFIKRLVREYGVIKLLGGLADHLRKFGKDDCDLELADELDEAADKYKKSF